jgi:hypothetical protein
MRGGATNGGGFDGGFVGLENLDNELTNVIKKLQSETEDIYKQMENLNTQTSARKGGDMEDVDLRFKK